LRLMQKKYMLMSYYQNRLQNSGIKVFTSFNIAQSRREFLVHRAVYKQPIK